MGDLDEENWKKESKLLVVTVGLVVVDDDERALAAWPRALSPRPCLLATTSTGRSLVFNAPIETSAIVGSLLSTIGIEMINEWEGRERVRVDFILLSLLRISSQISFRSCQITPSTPSSGSRKKDIESFAVSEAIFSPMNLSNSLLELHPCRLVSTGWYSHKTLEDHVNIIRGTKRKQDVKTANVTNDYECVIILAKGSFHEKDSTGKPGIDLLA